MPLKFFRIYGTAKYFYSSPALRARKIRRVAQVKGPQAIQGPK